MTRSALLGKFVEITSSKRIKRADYVSDGVPFYRSKEVIERAKGNKISTELFISEEQFAGIEKKFGAPQRGDILLTSVGTLGVSWQVEEDSTFYFKDGNLTWFRNFDSKLNSTYLLYWLRSRAGQQELDRVSIGSTQRALTIVALKSLPFSPPSISDQKAIAHILGTLDDKIELNQKMNQTLEEITKAIFKSWFVDFDPVRAKADGRPTGLPPEINDLFPDELVASEIGEIPKGWDYASLDQIGNFRNGLALQKYPAVEGEEQLPVVKIAQLRKGSTDGDELFASGVPQDFMIDDGDYIFSWSGSLMAKYWVGGKGALNQHLFKVEEKIHPMWFIAGWVDQYMSEFQSIAESKATTMGHIKREHLKQAICALPTANVLEKCTPQITPLIDRSIVSQQESKVLAELRDTLLAELISGELRISDAENFLEEVGI